MDYTTFRKIWDDSGLPEYYERMDDLQRLGYSFSGPNQDMDFHESKALSEWLGEDRSIMDVTLIECERALPEIRNAPKFFGITFEVWHGGEKASRAKRTRGAVRRCHH